MDFDSLRSDRDDIVRDGAPLDAYRAPADLIDSNHPKILSYARQVAGEGSDREKALRLYYGVRDGLRYDPYNTDHMYATQVALECRMIAQAWGYKPGEAVLGAPQLYLFEPHQTEQMGWKPDVFLDVTPVWDKKRAAIECMEGQEHLWDYYTRVAQNRANHVGPRSVPRCSGNGRTRQSTQSRTSVESLIRVSSRLRISSVCPACRRTIARTRSALVPK